MNEKSMKDTKGPVFSVLVTL